MITFSLKKTLTLPTQEKELFVQNLFNLINNCDGCYSRWHVLDEEIIYMYRKIENWQQMPYDNKISRFAKKTFILLI